MAEVDEAYSYSIGEVIGLYDAHIVYYSTVAITSRSSL